MKLLVCAATVLLATCYVAAMPRHSSEEVGFPPKFITDSSEENTPARSTSNAPQTRSFFQPKSSSPSTRRPANSRTAATYSKKSAELTTNFFTIVTAPRPSRSSGESKRRPSYTTSTSPPRIYTRPTTRRRSYVTKSPRTISYTTEAPRRSYTQPPRITYTQAPKRTYTQPPRKTYTAAASRSSFFDLPTRQVSSSSSKQRTSYSSPKRPSYTTTPRRSSYTTPKPTRRSSYRTTTPRTYTYTTRRPQTSYTRKSSEESRSSVYVNPKTNVPLTAEHFFPGYSLYKAPVQQPTIVYGDSNESEEQSRDVVVNVPEPRTVAVEEAVEVEAVVETTESSLEPEILVNDEVEETTEIIETKVSEDLESADEETTEASVDDESVPVSHAVSEEITSADTTETDVQQEAEVVLKESVEVATEAASSGKSLSVQVQEVNAPTASKPIVELIEEVNSQLATEANANSETASNVAVESAPVGAPSNFIVAASSNEKKSFGTAQSFFVAAGTGKSLTSANTETESNAALTSSVVVAAPAEPSASVAAAEPSASAGRFVIVLTEEQLAAASNPDPNNQQTSGQANPATKFVVVFESQERTSSLSAQSIQKAIAAAPQAVVAPKFNVVLASTEDSDEPLPQNAVDSLMTNFFMQTALQQARDNGDTVSFKSLQNVFDDNTRETFSFESTDAPSSEDF